MTTSKQVTDTFNKLLPNLGLYPSEVVVFTHLMLSGKPLRVTQLAKKTKMNRTTTYGVLKTLSKRGLVSSVTERGTLLYRSIQPHLLVDYIERARNELAAHTEEVKNMIPVIQSLRTHGLHPVPTVQFFEGTEGIKQAYEDTIENNPSKTICGFVGIGAAYKFLDPSWIQYYIDKRTAAKVHWDTIASESEESHKMKSHDKKECRTTKILPKGYDLDIEIAAYEDKVLLSTYVEDHPSAILIEDARIAAAMKTLFRYIDGTLK